MTVRKTISNLKYRKETFQKAGLNTQLLLDNDFYTFLEAFCTDDCSSQVECQSIFLMDLFAALLLKIFHLC